MVQCSDGSFYTGITTDVERRVEEHNSSDKGAKYTKMRRPVELVYQAEFENRSEASKEEYRIKQLKREAKEKLMK